MQVSTKVRMNDGAEIYVRLLGEDNGDKPLFIAQHGAPGASDHKESETSFAALADCFPVLVFDARGSGASDLCPPYTRARWAADIEELRVWAGADSFVIGGGSHGGTVALEYAITYPKRLKAMILRDTFARGTVMKNAFQGAISSDRASPDIDRQARLWGGTLRDDTDYAASLMEIASLFPAIAPESSSESSNEELDITSFHHETCNSALGMDMHQYDIRPRLEEITVPTLVVVGRHDFLAPVSYSMEISDAIPGAELRIFEKSGHSPPAEEPLTFQTCVKDFLASLNLIQTRAS